MASVLLSISSALAQPAPKKGSAKAQLGTSFKFDGTTLRGKYQTPLGTNATVEDDKYLDDLLGGRVRFTDKDQKEKQRN
jgi:hypothetical protein